MPWFICNGKAVFGFAIENYQQADLVYSPRTHKFYANIADGTKEIIELADPNEFWLAVDAIIREE